MITRIGLIALASALCIGCDHKESKPTPSNEPTAIRGGARVLIYRRDQPGAELTIMMSSFSGDANATVTKGSGVGAEERTISIPSDAFDSLFNAFAKTKPLAATELTDKSPAVESETHHIVTRMDRGTGEQGMFAVPLDGASDDFVAWFSELKQATSDK
jgi:hypothetical protein